MSVYNQIEKNLKLIHLTKVFIEIILISIKISWWFLKIENTNNEIKLFSRGKIL